MTLYLFKLLSPKVQLYLVLTRGTFLANRWEDEDGVNLYYLPDEGCDSLFDACSNDGYDPLKARHAHTDTHTAIKNPLS